MFFSVSREHLSMEFIRIKQDVPYVTSILEQNLKAYSKSRRPLKEILFLRLKNTFLDYSHLCSIFYSTKWTYFSPTLKNVIKYSSHHMISNKNLPMLLYVGMCNCINNIWIKCVMVILRFLKLHMRLFFVIIPNTQ